MDEPNTQSDETLPADNLVPEPGTPREVTQDLDRRGSTFADQFEFAKRAEERGERHTAAVEQVLLEAQAANQRPQRRDIVLSASLAGALFGTDSVEDALNIGEQFADAFLRRFPA